jgi:O-methyltransferase domain/Dimerisation domain
MPEPVENPAAALMRLTNGYQVSQAIHVAAVLRLADFVGAEPVAAEEIAPRVGAHPRSLYRLLRALSTVGIFRETDDRRFVGSAMSDLLRTDHPGSMWGYPAFIGRPRHREIWGDLLHSVRTGQDAPHHLWGVDGYQHLADKPEEIASFSAGQAAVSRTVAPAIIAAYDFSKLTRIVDVGGGNGALLAAILSASPQSSGVVFDLPHVVQEAASVIRTAGLDGRCEIVGGSYWDGVPAGGNAYIIKSVLMDKTDEEAANPPSQRPERNGPAGYAARHRTAHRRPQRGGRGRVLRSPDARWPGRRCAAPGRMGTALRRRRIQPGLRYAHGFSVLPARRPAVEMSRCW